MKDKAADKLHQAKIALSAG